MPRRVVARDPVDLPALPHARAAPRSLLRRLRRRSAQRLAADDGGRARGRRRRGAREGRYSSWSSSRPPAEHRRRAWIVAITASNQAWLGKIVDGRYRVLEVIGRGGMGVVYRVEHLRMGKIAAMKVLHRDLASDPEVVARFEREAAAVSQAPPPAHRAGLRLRHTRRARCT